MTRLRKQYEKFVLENKTQLGNVSFDRYPETATYFAGEYKNGVLEFGWKAYMASFKFFDEECG